MASEVMGNSHASFGERDGETRTMRIVKVRTVPTPLSPVLAHGYLPSAWDLWFDTVVKAHGRGAARVCRYADDWGGAFRSQDDAARCSRVLPQRLKQGNLQVAPEKPPVRRLSRVHPSRKRRVTLLGVEGAWKVDRPGVSRVRRRPARTKLQAACQRRTAWMKHHRHLPERACFPRLHARVRGHDHYVGVRGNAHARTRFCRWARDCTCTWLNRRGGKQSSDTWGQCPRVRDRVKSARPCITEVKRRSVFA